MKLKQKYHKYNEIETNVHKYYKNVTLAKFFLYPLSKTDQIKEVDYFN